MKKLEGKVAIITGGSGVIGYTTAKELAENGAKVMLVDINVGFPESWPFESREKPLLLLYEKVTF